MLITNTALQALRVGFKTEFQDAFDAVPKMKDRVAKTVRSTTAMNTYGWLKSLTGMREWLGNRIVDNLSEASYTHPQQVLREDHRRQPRQHRRRQSRHVLGRLHHDGRWGGPLAGRTGLGPAESRVSRPTAGMASISSTPTTRCCWPMARWAPMPTPMAARASRGS